MVGVVVVVVTLVLEATTHGTNDRVDLFVTLTAVRRPNLRTVRPADGMMDVQRMPVQDRSSCGLSYSF